MSQHGGVGEVGRVRWVPPGRWELWTRPRHVIGYVLLLDLAALGLTAAALLGFRDVTGTQWVHFAVLVVACAVYTELSRGIERVRREYKGTPHVELHSVWFFAATLLVPPGLVGLFVAAAAAQRWLRVRHHVAHRRIFATATTILAVHAGSSVLRLLEFDPTARTLANFGVVAAAACVYYVVGFAPIALVVLLTARRPVPRAVLGRGRDHAIEAATLGLGLLLAWALLDWWPAGLVVAGVTLVLHGTVLIRQLQDSARSDPKTGLLNVAGFDELAGRELDRASRQRTEQAALLVLDLDNFKLINDRHGHPAGDVVLAAAARTIAGEMRGYDIVGRFGGDEFMILLPATTLTEARHVADRIRRRLATLSRVIPSRDGPTHLPEGAVTASIGVAVYPTHGTTLTQLRQAADDAAYRAKAAGRDTVVTAAPRPDPAPSRR